MYTGLTKKYMLDWQIKMTKQKKIIIAIVAIAILLIAIGVFAYTYLHEEETTVWTFDVIPGEQRNYWITQEMIDCVGSNKADDLFANIDPPSAQIIVFQQDATGSWKSWCNIDPHNSLEFISINFPIKVNANVPSVITIYKCE
jgi:hypothetical protein